MNANEKIIVDFFWANSEEDSYENGILLNGESSCWSNSDIPVNGNYNSVREALEAVCNANGFTFTINDWERDPCGDNPCRFDTDIIVDGENCEATQNEIESWKSGNKRLWCCHLAVFLKVQSVPRDLTDDEMISWNK